MIMKGKRRWEIVEIRAVPLSDISDKGKPIVKWGRKATGQKILIAGFSKN